MDRETVVGDNTLTYLRKRELCLNLPDWHTERIMLAMLWHYSACVRARVCVYTYVRATVRVHT